MWWLKLILYRPKLVSFRRLIVKQISEIRYFQQRWNVMYIIQENELKQER